VAVHPPTQIQRSETAEVISISNAICPIRKLVATDGREVTIYWHPLVTGDWAKDNKQGRDYATRIVARAQAAGSPMLIFRVIGDMVRAGRFNGVEVGFVQKVAEYLGREG